MPIHPTVEGTVSRSMRLRHRTTTVAIGRLPCIRRHRRLLRITVCLLIAALPTGMRWPITLPMGITIRKVLHHR